MMRYEGGRILIELLPDDPHQALGDFSYSEEEHEEGAEEWLREVARAGR